MLSWICAKSSNLIEFFFNYNKKRKAKGRAQNYRFKYEMRKEYINGRNGFQQYANDDY